MAGGPFVEVLVVAVRLLGLGPVVERLVDKEETRPVAQVEERGGPFD